MSKFINGGLEGSGANITGVLGIFQGGTNANNARDAITNLLALDKSSIGTANGLAPYSARGLDSRFIENDFFVTLDGPSVVKAGIAVTYKITNYDSYLTYDISTTEGVASITGDTIQYTPSTKASNTWNRTGTDLPAGDGTSSYLWSNILYKKIATGNDAWLVTARCIKTGTTFAQSDAIAYSSDNGNSWSKTVLSLGHWETIITAKNNLVAFSSAGNKSVAISTNGTAWTVTNTGLTDNLRSAVFDGNSIVALSSLFSNVDLVSNLQPVQKTYTSLDNGATWTAGGSLPTSEYWCGLAYGNSTIVAISGYNSVSDAFAYSNNAGATWTAVTLATSQKHKWKSVTFNKNLFIAIGKSSTGASVAVVSIDGIVWTDLSVPNGEWSSIVAFNNAIVVTEKNSNKSIISFGDCSYWQDFTMPLTADWEHSGFGEGYHIAVSSVGSPAVIKSIDFSQTAGFTINGRNVRIPLLVPPTGISSSAYISTPQINANQTPVTAAGGVKIIGSAFRVVGGTGTDVLSKVTWTFYDSTGAVSFTKDTGTTLEVLLDSTTDSELASGSALWTNGFTVKATYYTSTVGINSVESNSVAVTAAGSASATTPNIGKVTISSPVRGTLNVPLRTSTRCSSFTTSGTSGFGKSEWVISKTAGFTVVEPQSYTGPSNESQLSVILDPNQDYFVKVRHYDLNGNMGPFSDPVTFKTALGYVDKPIITYPVQNARNLPSSFTFLSSVFQTVPVLNPAELCSEVLWELALDQNFTTVVQRYQGLLNGSSWTVSGLTKNQTYYARVTHTGSNLGKSDPSSYVEFTTAQGNIATPIITAPLPGANSISTTPTFRTSGWSVSPAGIDTLKTVHWYLSTKSDFSSDVVEETSLTSELSWTPTTPLILGKKYYLKVSFAGNVLTTPEYSALVDFTTMAGAINKPVITNNVTTGVSLTPTFTASTFATTPVNIDTILGSEWEIVKKSDWSINSWTNPLVLIKATSNNNTLVVASPLDVGIEYFVRMRYKGNTVAYSNYSDHFTFSTVTGVVNKPSILSPAMSELGVSLAVVAKASAFSVAPATSVAAITKAEWVISTSNDITDAAKHVRTMSMTNDGPAIFPSLSSETPYYIFVRYEGGVLGWSPWSNGVQFTTDRYQTSVIPSTVSAGDLFGGAGETEDSVPLMVVGSYGAETAGFDASGLAHIYRKAGRDWVLEQTLSPSDPYNLAWFGKSVAISGDGQRLVVAAVRHHGDDANQSTAAGKLYTFVPSVDGQGNRVWVPETTMWSTVRDSQEVLLGWSLAINYNGDKILAGVRHGNGYGLTRSVNDAGRAMLFVKTTVGWNRTESQILWDDNGKVDDVYGGSLAMSGDGNRLVISSMLRENTKLVAGVSTTYIDSGEVSIYSFNPASSSWTHDTTIDAVGFTGSKSAFGSGICINYDGTRMAIGAPFKNNDGAVDTGEAYIYNRNSDSTWTQGQVFTMPTPTTTALFGLGIDISDSGNRVVIAAPGGETTSAMPNCGIFWYTDYNVTTGTWSALTNISNNDVARSNWMGCDLPVDTTYTMYRPRGSISLSGDGSRLIVGGSWATSGAKTGKVIVFNL